MVSIKIEFKWRDVLLFLAGVGLLALGITVYRQKYVNTEFQVVDCLGGNIFPSYILSVATTNLNLIHPIDTPYVGNPKMPFAIRIRSRERGTKVRVEVSTSEFFSSSVSEFVLPRSHTDYVVYPDIIWNYDALRNNRQAAPVSVVVKVNEAGEDLGQRVHIMSVRSINECLLGYIMVQGKCTRFKNTGMCFAAYVNEEHPMIDKLLREALNSGIVNRFLGYQGDSAQVCRQVYALWNTLQHRDFKYSSVSYSSLSSNVVYSQRVRTISDALNSSQINCVDGSVLFASLLRAINIDPVLIRIPGHMFVGFYTDHKHKSMQCLETTMIGDADFDEFFPNEQLDSTLSKVSRAQASRLTFEKSMQYANRKYAQYAQKLRTNSAGFMFLEITKNLRSKIQPIGT